MRFARIIVLNFLKALTYRSEVLMWLLLDSVPLLLQVLIWVGVYGYAASAGNGAVSYQGFNLSQMISYYFVGSYINGFTATHFESWRVQEIRDGKIDYFLTKPLAYPLMLLLSDIGGKLFFWLVLGPWQALIWVGLVILYNLTPLNLTAENLLVFAVLLIFGYVVEFFFAMIIVFAGFWIEGAEGLEHFKWIVITMLSGWILPPALMPSWLRQLVIHSPFQYMYAVPIEVILGKRSLTGSDAISPILLLLVLIIISTILWKNAAKRYASAGG